MPLDSKNLVFFSDYNIDKIVRVYSGFYSIPQDTITKNYGFLGDQELFRIKHDLGRPVATDLQWADTISVIKQENVNFAESATYDSNNQTFASFSDKDYIYIISPYTSFYDVYYRVFCRWIDDFDNTDPSITPITYTTQPIQFDSRANFQKIYQAGTVNFSAGTGGATQTVTVPHTLGYAPNVKVWVESFDNEVWPLNGGGSSNSYLISLSQDEYEMSITSSNISIKIFKYSNKPRRAWYRIYYDAN